MGKNNSPSRLLRLPRVLSTSLARDGTPANGALLSKPRDKISTWRHSCRTIPHKSRTPVRLAKNEEFPSANRKLPRSAPSELLDLQTTVSPQTVYESRGLGSWAKRVWPFRRRFGFTERGLTAVPWNRQMCPCSTFVSLATLDTILVFTIQLPYTYTFRLDMNHIGGGAEGLLSTSLKCSPGRGTASDDITSGRSPAERASRLMLKVVISVLGVARGSLDKSPDPAP